MDTHMVVGVHTAEVDTHQTSMQTRAEAMAHMTNTGLCLKVETRGKWKEGRRRERENEVS